MKKFLSLFTQSAAELKKLRSLTGIAMLVALNVALSFATIPIGSTMKISISFLAIAIMGMLYGPVAAGMGAALGDILSYLLTPGNSMGAYFFGFTLTAFLGGIVYGIAFYSCKVSVDSGIFPPRAQTIPEYGKKERWGCKSCCQFAAESVAEHLLDFHPVWQGSRYRGDFLPHI